MAALVRRSHELGVLYASEDWSPLSDITLALLLARAGIRWRYVPLEGLADIVWPPVCGVAVLHVAAAQTPGEKRLAVRHGLGHVLAGHLTDVRYCHDGHDPFGHAERVADLFALVDLVPDRVLGDRQTAGYTPAELEAWVSREVRRYGARWPEDRIQDRARLRLLCHG